MKNTIEVFELESSPVRGRCIELSSVLDKILSTHSYPEDITKIAAQAIIITSLFSSLFKYDGVFSFQMQAKGRIKALLCDIASNGTIRLSVSFDDNKTLGQTLGEGIAIFTVDPESNTERYQGIVELKDTLEETMLHYFNQSEQIRTAFKISIEHTERSGWGARALLLQELPDTPQAKAKGNTAQDDWRRIMMMLETCQDKELNDRGLSSQDLIYRLFHEDGIIVYTPVMLKNGCRCSKEKIESALKSMDQETLNDLVVDSAITTVCEFCKTEYQFDPKAISG